MSEIQNRAVDLMRMDPEAHPLTLEELRDNVFKASFALYCSLGGSEAKAKALMQSSEDYEGDVATLVGELMVTTAGVSHLQDMDMMQAAYNTLRRRYRQISSAA